MGRRHSLDLGSISPDELADLGVSVDEVMCGIFKIDTRRAVLALERRMTAAFSAAWQSAAREGLTEGIAKLLRGPFTDTRINSFLRGLGVKLSDTLTSKQEKLVEGRVRSIYSLSKREAVRQAKGKFVFGALDTRAIAATNNQQMFWINGFYGDQLSSRVSAVSRDVLLEQGLGRREAGRTLMSALRKDLGLAPGAAPSEFAASVPARYAGNPQYYFEQVASVAGHQGRVFGRMRGFKDVGVVTFELINPMDERTGQVCQEMHGQVFSVDVGVSRMDAIVRARTPDAVKRSAPWLSGKELQNLLKGTQKGSSEASRRLEGKNVVLPPFHPLCRTEPVIVS